MPLLLFSERVWLTCDRQICTEAACTETSQRANWSTVLTASAKSSTTKKAGKQERKAEGNEAFFLGHLSGTPIREMALA